MTGAGARSAPRLRGATILVGALWLLAGAFAPVDASPVGCLDNRIQPVDDFFRAESSIVLGADGSVYISELGTYGVSSDPAGDAVNRAGDPTENPDALCAAMLMLIEPDSPALDALGFVDAARFTLVLPEEPGDQLTQATELVAVTLEFRGDFPAVTSGVAQFGISFDSSEFPNYTGPAIELNGRDTTFDVYRANDTWNLGTTTYRNGSFDFVPNVNMAAVIGAGRVTVFFPESILPVGLETVGFFAVSGNGVDVGTIGTFDPANLLSVARSGAMPTPAPTTPAAAAPTATPRAAAAPTSSPVTGGGGVSTTDDGGLSWLLPAGLVGLLIVAAGIVALSLLRRRSTAPTTSVSEVAAAVIARDVAITQLSGRAWKVTDANASGSRTALLAVAGLVAVLILGGVVAYAGGLFRGPPTTGVAPSPSSTAAPSVEPTGSPAPSPSAPAAARSFTDVTGPGLWLPDAGTTLDGPGGGSHSDGDTSFLLVRLHSASIDRYGPAVCQAYVTAVVDPATALVPGEVSGPASWDYFTDGFTTTVPEAWTVTASGSLQGRAVADVEFHVAMEDGTFRWFTDCGGALP